MRYPRRATKHEHIAATCASCVAHAKRPNASTSQRHEERVELPGSSRNVDIGVTCASDTFINTVADCVAAQCTATEAQAAHQIFGQFCSGSVAPSDTSSITGTPTGIKLSTTGNTMGPTSTDASTKCVELPRSSRHDDITATCASCVARATTMTSRQPARRALPAPPGRHRGDLRDSITRAATMTSQQPARRALPAPPGRHRGDLGDLPVVHRLRHHNDITVTCATCAPCVARDAKTTSQ
ncbi:hypothetical protein BC826DRAFT_1111669 [Russula brevipes]|nr:hypothetical protein BC826DRAFT_1111669 [Russula brevipes]